MLLNTVTGSAWVTDNVLVILAPGDWYGGLASPHQSPPDQWPAALASHTATWHHRHLSLSAQTLNQGQVLRGRYGRVGGGGGVLIVGAIQELSKIEYLPNLILI